MITSAAETTQSLSRVVEIETSTSKITFTPFIAANKLTPAEVSNRMSVGSVNIGNMWAQLQEHDTPTPLPQITDESFRPFNEKSLPASHSSVTSGRPNSPSPSHSTSSQKDISDSDNESITKKASANTIVADIPINPSTRTDTAAEKGGNAWDGYLDDDHPEKSEPKYVRNLRHIVFSLYRRIFGIVFIVNMSIFIHALSEGGLPANEIGTIVVGNICGAVLMRQVK